MNQKYLILGISSDKINRNYGIPTIHDLIPLVSETRPLIKWLSIMIKNALKRCQHWVVIYFIKSI